MRILLSEDAKRDIQDISIYTRAAWGENQEKAYLVYLAKKLEEINQKPSFWRKREDLFPNCQIAQAKKHLIYFVLRDDCIYVSRILHQSMDSNQHTFPLE